MKPEELRIGNYVSITEAMKKSLFEASEIILEQDCFKVALVSEDGANLYVDGDEEEFYLEDLLPIPLTKEWLIRFGFSKFEKIGNYDVFIAFKIGSISINNRMAMYFNNKRITDDIKYVHQLQNIYFALTEKELILANLK